jgi:hypothetical protein
MFLATDQRLGAPYLVFTVIDPRADGYKGELVENVSLDYDELKVHHWGDGERSPDACVGVAPEDPKHYKVFKYAEQLQAAGYKPVAGTAVTFFRWLDYVNLSKKPPHPGLFAIEDWFGYLEKFDDITREWRRNANGLVEPERKDRDSVAAWVAKSHFIVDSAIREVWYLPKDAPTDEIRLLELNDRLAGNESKVEPLDYGLDVEGADFRLMVADVTTDQMEQIKQKAQPLPPGWSLDGNMVWRRGA